MSRLSDGDIIQAYKDGVIGIDPFVEENVQPASVDLRLGTTVIPFRDTHPWYVIDPQCIEEERVYFPPTSTEGEDGFILHSGQCVLADTIEHIYLPDSLQVDVYGRSSLGRLGLLIHISAGFCDPGWDGSVTLEIVNMGPQRFRLRHGLRIAQIAFNTMTSPAQNPYGAHRGSKYKGQTGPTMSRLDRDRENVR